MTTINGGQGRWAKRVLGGLGILVLLALALSLATMGMNNTGMMFMGNGQMWGSGWLGWGLMWFMGLLWMAAVIAIPVAVVYWLVGGRQTQGTSGEDTALAILREQHARGEIDEEEYETRRTTLENH